MILEAKNFSVVAHEFKTPINVISSTAQIVIKANRLGKLSDEKLEEYMLSIKHYCNKLDLLANNILDSTPNLESNVKCDYETLNITEFICNFVKNLLPYSQKFDFILNSEIDVNEVLFACDYTKLERILLNLISNAVKYNDKPVKKIHIKAYDDDNYMIFTIKDNGIGIPSNMLDSITERFFRVENFATRKTDGCGLGLFIVEHFLQLLNGRMRINSIEGYGSEFIIYLPKKVELSATANEPHMTYDYKTNQIDIEFSSLNLRTD